MPTLLLLLLSACGGPEVSGVELVAGDYQFYTLAVDDGCLDGALAALFMPDGRDQSKAFDYPIYVPGWDDLPTTYAVDFREPFVGMDVMVTEGDGGTLAIRGSVMDAVALGAAYGDCVATMAVDLDLTPVEAGRLDGAATLYISDPRGSDGLCPVFHAEPCELGLDLEALRMDDR